MRAPSAAARKSCWRTSATQATGSATPPEAAASPKDAEVLPLSPLDGSIRIPYLGSCNDVSLRHWGAMDHSAWWFWSDQATPCRSTPADATRIQVDSSGNGPLVSGFR